MSDAAIGYGGTFAIESDESPGEYVNLAEVKSVNIGADTIEQVEVTHMQSPNRTREYTSGMISPTVCSVTMNYVPGSVTDLRILELKAAAESFSCKFTYRGVEKTFSAIIESYDDGGEITPEGVPIATLNLQRSYVTQVTGSP